jgi:hypothetical protein
MSADSREIVFLGVDGNQKTYSIGNVSGIDFAPLVPGATPAAQLSL